jgi:hypothetical protein
MYQHRHRHRHRFRFRFRFRFSFRVMDVMDVIDENYRAKQI